MEDDVVHDARSPEIETRPKMPYIVIEPNAPTEEAETLQQLSDLVANHPDFAKSTYEAYIEDPEAADKIIDLLLQHPEGLAVFALWKRVVEKRHDLTANLDQETETAIEADAYYISSKEKFKSTGDEVHRTQMRRRRVHIWAKRAEEAA